MSKHRFLSAMVVLVVWGAWNVLSLAQAPSTAPSADITGDWKWTLMGPNGDNLEYSGSFKQEGEKVTGTIHEGFDGATTKFEDGAIKDRNITLKYKRDFNGQPIGILYNGKLEADGMIRGQLEISIDANTVFNMDWRASRAKPTTQPAK